MQAIKDKEQRKRRKYDDRFGEGLKGDAKKSMQNLAKYVEGK